jgi:hypothetical protein
MDKGIGFNRNIKLEWLDAVAAFCAETDDPAEIRARLRPVLAQDRTGTDAIRKSIDILINIWLKSSSITPDLHQRAVTFFQAATVPDDRIWLHYGLTILYYPFFRQCAAAIGQLSRYQDAVTNKAVVKRMMDELGQLGSLERSAQRVVASLRDWGVLTSSDQRHAYAPQHQAFGASGLELEAWFLACTLRAHPFEEIPFADLLNLPALFPFRFTVTIGDLRQLPGFQVQRQGMGLDMVRAVQADREN